MILISTLQMYIWLRMDFFRIKPDYFYYSILFLLLIGLFIGLFRRSRIWIIGSLLLIAFFAPVPYYFKYIYDYSYNKAIVNAEALTQDLNDYHKIHNEFPKNLSELYGIKSQPNYKIGVLTYYYTYRKIDSSYRIYFHFFDGSVFCRYSPYKLWTTCD